MRTNLNTHAKQSHRPTARQTIGPATLGWNPAPLEGYGAAPVQIRFARGSDAPSSGAPPRSGGWTPPHARGPASVEGRAPPRASFRLARGDHRPAASIPAPPAGAFNALTFAGAKSKANPRHYTPGNHALALLRQLPWRGHPCHCAMLCGVVSKRPAALYHPLPYGWRTAPSKKDDGTLEGMTHDYSAPTRDDAVTSGQWERSPPSP
jgi:hypothetical protein